LLSAAMAEFSAQKKMMFGSPVYTVGGNMFTGVHQRALFLRLSPADQAALIQAYPEAGPFEPMPGRRMKEYLVLPEALYRNEEDLDEWLNRGYQLAASLPPKTPKPRRKKQG
jgi:TfoX/Sxy family transcriptional regulator of competence genes